MTTKITSGADNFIKALELAGVTKVFTLSGNHIMPAYNSIFDSKINLTTKKREQQNIKNTLSYDEITSLYCRDIT
jgi:acetolactate synthase-1/2/3 large subunit